MQQRFCLFFCCASDGLTDITQITMLIFDECHHTVKNEPYNQIMRVYLDKRCEKKDAKLPQVCNDV